jgi:diadenosine tetraphosphatase ApaH/serine/threonine PP2A family protein phosphatase
MRYLVLSDIHSNVEALDACVGRAERAGYDRVLCCGDIVGYGPNPTEVMDILAGLNPTSIRGNHDRVAAGLDEPTDFSTHAREAVYWTRNRLSATYQERLAALPLGPLAIENAQLVHGTIADEDEYLVTEDDAAANLECATQRITFYGHTHEAVAFALDEDEMLSVSVPQYAADGTAFIPVTGAKLIVNPGSVGQPRDRDPRASFLIWDSTAERLEFYRVPYAIEVTQAKIRRAGLPEFLAYRLALGR